MFCLHEESLANHIGERKPRMNKEDLDKQNETVDEVFEEPEELDLES